MPWLTALGPLAKFTITMPNIWVCRTGGSDIETMRRGKFAGFRLHSINPMKFRSESELQQTILADLAEESRDRNYSGATFGRQIWQISHDVQVGDVIYIDHPNIAEKPKDPGLKPGKRSKQRTFIIAAGLVTETYRYDTKNWHCHKVGVDWKWRGQVLIDFGFQSQIFVHIDSRHPKVLDDLRAIWTPGKGSALPPPPIPPPRGAQTPDTHLDYGWEEGQEVLKTHLKIERSAAAANAAKEAARARGKGVIHCDSCGKAPVETYGVEIIDAHHVVPLADTKGMSRTSTPADFAMLCPTCHRAVHYVLSKGRAEGRDAIEEVRRSVFTIQGRA